MPYIRIHSGYAEPATTAPGAHGATSPEGEVWSGVGSRPFVLVTHKSWRPPTDIYETSADVVIKMEVAGLHADSLQIVIHNDLLTIRGRRTDETGRHKIGYHHMGITYGEFASDIRLPGPIEQEQVRAALDAGFLTITLPKQPPRASGAVRIAVTE